jgi:FixJ family two-component response regulator
MWRTQCNAGARVPKDQIIAIVDDDQFVRESVKRLMKSLGFMVMAYPSASDFLESPHLQDIACLIADIHMPGMTGVELHKYLADAGRAIPTILVTAYPDDRDRVRAQKDGVIGYLTKPFSEANLIHHVRSALAHNKPLRYNS